MGDKLTAVCFGEVLFDDFPNRSRIGGAPLNVCQRLSSFGCRTYMISAVGNDQAGKKLMGYLDDVGVITDYIQVMDDYPTGRVTISLDQGGNATYDIKYPVAWDKISFDSDLYTILEKADLFYYGSLARRDEVTWNTLHKLLGAAKFKVLDLNLRPPFYSMESLKDLLELADFVKLNDDELYELASSLKSGFYSIEKNILFLASYFKIESICVTMGPHGAVLFHNGKFYGNTGYRVEVLDTVGSGDSFLATLMQRLLSGEDTQEALDYACAVGALVASSEGANPILRIRGIKELMGS